jgi:O-antigen ligase
MVPASDGPPGLPLTPRIGALLAPLALGMAGGAAVVAVADRLDWKLAALLVVAVPLAVAAVLRPRFGMLLAMFAFAFMEEFRGGIGDTGAGGDEFLRSERTPFYAATIGVPGLYLPDLIVAGLLLLFLLRALIHRSRIGLQFDAIGAGLLLIATAVLLSIVFGLAGPDPFGPPVLDLSTLGSITLPEKNVSDVARYFPVLQYKLFLILFPSYLLGLLFFREDRDVRQAVIAVGLAMLATLALGGYRFVTKPGVLTDLVPVVFDTGSVALMAMSIFYMVSLWACGLYRPAQLGARALLCLGLGLLILLSFRRSMWGAVALAALFVPVMLHGRARARLVVLGGLGLLAGLAVLGSTAGGQALLQSVVERAEQTNLNQSSTLYRFAIITWLFEHYTEIPVLGYGLQPLWNEIVRIRFFVTSMENVHSLYLWILLRTGWVGFGLCGVALALILLRVWQVFRGLADDRYRVLVGVVFLSIVMYLFNGIFNPVYAHVRHLVPLGLSLALVTNLPRIAARRSRPESRDEALPAP